MITITAVEIENFKAFGARQRIELRPITLLFGPNSSGKSTILQALHYFRDILERHNLDADNTMTGGESVNLGGFRNFVHGHDLSRTIRIAVEISPDSADGRSTGFPRIMGNGRDGPVSAALETVDRATVEVCVAWNQSLGRPFVSRFAVLYAGTELASIEAREEPELVTELRPLNIHDGVAESDPNAYPDKSETDALETLFRRHRHDFGSACPQLDQRDALPDIVRGLRLKERQSEPETEQALALCNRALLEPARRIVEILREMCYIGPIRQRPLRYHIPPHARDNARWATGLAAWDRLSECSAEQLDDVNSWIAGKDRLATGYKIVRRAYCELETEGLLMRRMLAGGASDEWQDLVKDLQALPIHKEWRLHDEANGTLVDLADVGEGISQVIPLVVAALIVPTQFLVIEQPELHVHPRVQVALGDLLIRRMEEARNTEHSTYAGHEELNASTSLIETHSEHLLLRLLRRLRQGAEGSLPAGIPRLQSSELAVIYIRSCSTGAIAQRLRISEEGDFQDDWPDGFFDERGKELFE